MKNLKEIIKKSGFSQREIAVKLGISEFTLSKYIRGITKPSYETLIALADELKTSIDLIVGRDKAIINPPYKEEIATNLARVYSILEKAVPDLDDCSDCVSVPLLEDTIAAGTPVPISGQSSESRFFVKSWLKRFQRPLLVTVGKNQKSMLPTIHPGDLLLIDRRMVLEPLPENIYAVNAGEGGTVKRCALVNGKLKLIPDNPDYSEHIIDVSQVDISRVIVGRVVWIGREFA